MMELLFWAGEIAGAILVSGLVLIFLGLRQINQYAAEMNEDREYPIQNAFDDPQ